MTTTLNITTLNTATRRTRSAQPVRHVVALPKSQEAEGRQVQADLPRSAGDKCSVSATWVRVPWEHMGEAITQGHGRSFVPSDAVKRRRARIVRDMDIDTHSARSFWKTWARNLERVAESPGGFVCGLVGLVLMLGLSPMMLFDEPASPTVAPQTATVEVAPGLAQPGAGTELPEFMTR